MIHIYIQPSHSRFPFPLSFSSILRAASQSRAETGEKKKKRENEKGKKKRKKSVDKVWRRIFRVFRPVVLLGRIEDRRTDDACVAIGRQRGSDGSRSVIRAAPSLSTPVGRCLIKRDVKWGRSIKARPSDKFDSPDSRLIPRVV